MRGPMGNVADVGVMSDFYSISGASAAAAVWSMRVRQ
jgi:hypothetical protein